MVYLHGNGSFVAVETYMNNMPQIGISTFKIHELHVQIDGKIRNLLTFLDFGCHFGSHFENGGHFEIFSAKFGLGDVRKR